MQKTTFALRGLCTCILKSLKPPLQFLSVPTSYGGHLVTFGMFSSKNVTLHAC